MPCINLSEYWTTLPECVKSCQFLVDQKSHMRTHPRDESGVTCKMMSLLMMIMMTIMMMMVQASYMKNKGAAPCERLILPPILETWCVQKHVTTATNLFHERVHPTHVVKDFKLF